MTTSQLKYRPGLDGLRAIALLAVLGYHADVPWLDGGFNGLTLFFTISGFLVTTLLLNEHRDHSGIELKRFWTRRARRLLPSASLVIGLVLIVTPLLGDAVQRNGLRFDAIGALGYFANWRFLLQGTSYADQFGAQSPLLHYWSLAIEEQFYFVWPLVVAFVLGQYRPRPEGRKILAGVVAAGIIVSFVLTLNASTLDRLYFGTGSRAAELMVGAMLAILMHSPQRASYMLRFAKPLAPSALLGFVLLCFFADLDDQWIRNGGLIMLSGVSAVLTAAAYADGWFARVFAISPLQEIGRISYTVYLVHWPIFVFLTEQRTGLGYLPVLILRFVSTFAVATFIYHAFECPLRYRRYFAKPRAAFAGVLVASMLLVTGAVVTPVPATTEIGEGDFTIKPDDLAAEAVRVAVVGDHASFVAESFKDDARYDIEIVVATPGCPMPVVEAVKDTADSAPLDPNCEPWATTWQPAIDADVDLIVLAQGVADLTDQRVSGLWVSIDELNGALLFTREVENFLRAAATPGRSVIIAPIAGSTLRHVVVNEKLAKAATNAVGVTMLASIDGDGLEQARDEAMLEAGRGWPKPFGVSAPRPLRVLTVGDSTSFWISVGLEAVTKQRDDMTIGWVGSSGCGVVRLDTYYDATNEAVDSSECPRFDNEWIAAARIFDPDVIVVISSVIDAAKYEFPGRNEPIGFGDEEFDAFWQSEAEAALKALARTGAVVLWADSPGVQMMTTEGTKDWNPRLERYNELVNGLVKSHEQVGGIGLAARIGPPGTPVDHDVRPDGVHLGSDAAVELAESWLVDAIIAGWTETVSDALTTGCLTGDGPRPQIVLERCAAS